VFVDNRNFSYDVVLIGL